MSVQMFYLPKASVSGDSAFIIVSQPLLTDVIFKKKSLFYIVQLGRIGISHYNKTDGVKLSDKDTNTK